MPSLSPVAWLALAAGFLLIDGIGYVAWRNAATIQKILKDCTTENNGESYDVIRVIVLLVGASGFPTFLGLTVYSVYASPDHHFPMAEFGGALCAILVGLCTAAIGVGQKQKTDQPG